ncbi:MAG: GntR family transcriptional regulator [Gemmatimonadaceae bacterium]
MPYKGVGPTGRAGARRGARGAPPTSESTERDGPARRRSPAPASDSRRPTVAAAGVYTRVRDLIVRGRLLPGARVTETEVATRLAVSRTPAREALRRLHHEGLLVAAARGGRGAQTRLAVAPMTRDDVMELYHLAGALEGVVARAAARLPTAGRRALAAELRSAEVAFRIEARTRPPDFDRLFERHDAFHRALVDSCAGPRTRALLETIRPQLDRYEWYYAPLIGPDFRPTFAEHAAIIDAVRSGDPDAAERAVRANWWYGAERLAAVVDRLGGRQDGW